MNDKNEVDDGVGFFLVLIFTPVICLYMGLWGIGLFFSNMFGGLSLIFITIVIGCLYLRMLFKNNKNEGKHRVKINLEISEWQLEIIKDCGYTPQEVFDMGMKERLLSWK